ncbi:MAG: cytochrome c oxidase subunit II [Gemmatimonadota bacterium]
MRRRSSHTGWVRAGLALGLLAAIAVTSCGGPFPQSALHPNSDFAWKLQDLFRGIFWWAVVVFVLVEGALLVAIIRFRARPGDPRPRAVHGNTILEISWTLAPAVVLMLIAIPTIRTIWEVDRPPAGEAMVIEVVGHQWWWEFRYPEQDVVAANELHVPLGRTVNVRLTSADVIHSFWFPRIGGKRDVIPGHETRIWFTADSAGTYLGQCAEFCGLAHALMKMRLVVEPEADFAAWVEANRAAAASPVGDLATEGGRAFLASGCMACHAVRGTAAAGTVGPDLTHVGSRGTIAAGVLENTPEAMARWLRDPQAVKPGAKMPNLGLDEARIEALVAYLGGLR